MLAFFLSLAVGASAGALLWFRAPRNVGLVVAIPMIPMVGVVLSFVFC